MKDLRASTCTPRRIHPCKPKGTHEKSRRTNECGERGERREGRRERREERGKRGEERGESKEVNLNGRETRVEPA